MQLKKEIIPKISETVKMLKQTCMICARNAKLTVFVVFKAQCFWPKFEKVVANWLEQHVGIVNARRE